MKLKIIALFALLAILAGCTADKTENQDIANTLSARVMYSVALDYLYQDNRATATATFKDIIKRYPYTEEALESSIILIWIYYQSNSFIDAEIEIDSFIKNNPTHKYIPWVKYIKGLVLYEQMGEVTRQQASAEEALLIFKEIISRHPKSPYVKDAELRIETIKDHIAGKQMEIGVFYQKREEYIAAIGRFNEIIKTFNDSVFIEEALYRLVSSWVALGVLEEAYYNLTILGYNYPNSVWYAKAYRLLEKTGKLKELEVEFSALNKKWYKKSL